jgi:hypothetical protein
VTRGVHLLLSYCTLFSQAWVQQRPDRLEVHVQHQLNVKGVGEQSPA